MLKTIARVLSHISGNDTTSVDLEKQVIIGKFAVHHNKLVYEIPGDVSSKNYVHTHVQSSNEFIKTHEVDTRDMSSKQFTQDSIAAYHEIYNLYQNSLQDFALDFAQNVFGIHISNEQEESFEVGIGIMWNGMVIGLIGLVIGLVIIITGAFYGTIYILYYCAILLLLQYEQALMNSWFLSST